MNIFVTSPCPIESAKALDNKRVNKMLLESAQMLASALITHHAPIECMPMTQAGAPYKISHLNHPCSIWARTNRENFLWLLKHAKGLSDEYTKAYGKKHWVSQFLDRIEVGSKFIPEGKLSDFANCSLYKNGDVVSQYRQTMQEKWAVDKRPPDWKNRSKPVWASF